MSRTVRQLFVLFGIQSKVETERGSSVHCIFQDAEHILDRATLAFFLICPRFFIVRMSNGDKSNKQKDGEQCHERVVRPGIDDLVHHSHLRRAVLINCTGFFIVHRVSVREQGDGQCHPYAGNVQQECLYKMIPCEVDVFEVRNRQGVDETRKRRDEETQRDDGHQHQCFEEDEFVVASIAVFGCIHGNEHIGCADGEQIQNNGQWSEVVLHCVVCVCTIYYIPTQIFSTFFCVCACWPSDSIQYRIVC